jgi:hypothetical protein
MIRSASLLALLALAACSTGHQVTMGAPSPGQPGGQPGGPPVTMGAATSPASVTLAETPKPLASASAPAPSAPLSADPAPAAPLPERPAPAEAPLPAVRVANIGMHIGGGPNDDLTKDPIRRSVQPHFDEFRRCFAQVEEAGKGGDFGVDLRIDREGGKARVSHPRTSLKGKEFKSCVVHAFEAIDFLKPRLRTTTVSYSLRFSPG